ncbi:hypothetical protein ACFTZB_11715, partial [Rhodococcus sp. NPDC057014]|uniref:hypothetical protein n=1 Tax=Rhodococcus sp. NPDC057014 TaxID=3346000 RepID=UPI0036444841
MEERLVVDNVEPQSGPRYGDRLDQPAGPLRGDHRRAATGAGERIQPQVEFLLTLVEFVAGDLHQRGQLA